MPRKAPTISIEVKAGDKYASLDEAFNAALPLIAHDISGTIQKLIAQGLLINQNGKIVPSRERVKTT
jgi:hypothetical protein